MSEFLLVSSTFPRSQLLAVVLVFGLLLAFGGLMIRLHAIAFGPATGDSKPVTASLGPLIAHVVLVLGAGLFLPRSLVAWFETVAAVLG
jgi:hydrogenase-4 component F